MRLVSYQPCGGAPFRRLCLLDARELDAGPGQTLNLFGCVFTNAIVEHIDEFSYISLPQSSDWSFDRDAFAKENPDYSNVRFGPVIETVLDAHILKGAWPELLDDHDMFVLEVVKQMKALPKVDADDVDLCGSKLSYRRQEINTWELYASYLLMERDMSVVYGQDENIHFQSNYIPKQGLDAWVIEFNKRLMRLAQEADLLCGYFCLEDDRGRQPTSAVYFVSPTGSVYQRRLDTSEFIHIGLRGNYPEMIISHTDETTNFTFEYSKFLPPDYNRFRDLTRSSNSLELLRYI